MRRRDFTTILGWTAVAWPLAVGAQQPDRMRRISVLMALAENDPDSNARVEAFQQGLEKLGWKRNLNFRIDYHWAAGDTERIRDAIAELTRLAPDAVLADGTQNLRAVLSQTRSIPVVFVMVSDPVGQGFVENLARPGANVTGFTNFEPVMGGKWLELLKEVAPKTARVATIYNPQTTPSGGSFFLKAIEAAAKPLSVQLATMPVHSEAEIRVTIASLRAGDGLMTLPDVFTDVHRALIVQLAAGQQVPAIYPFRSFVGNGGLMSYGIDVVDQYRQAATYVDRILKGAKPSDLPVQAPNKFELLINLKTAKALGLTVPPALLVSADEVIE